MEELKGWMWLFIGTILTTSKIFETVFSNMATGRKMLGGDKERVKVGYSLSGYCNDLKLMMVKDLITWIKINENGNAETNTSNTLEMVAVRLSNRADVGLLVGWGKLKNDGKSTVVNGIKQSGNEVVMEKMLR